MHQNDEDGKKEHGHTRLKRVRGARARLRKCTSITASYFNAIVLRDSRCRNFAIGAGISIGKKSAKNGSTTYLEELLAQVGYSHNIIQMVCTSSAAPHGGIDIAI